jgi:hypothetical protein
MEWSTGLRTSGPWEVLQRLGSYPVSEREKLLAANEALFREMNERVEERVALTEPTTFEILCECARLECTERITLTTEEYEAAHSDPAQFTVVPGHVTHDIEEVVAHNDRFETVRKKGEAAEVAEDLA